VNYHRLSFRYFMAVVYLQMEVDVLEKLDGLENSRRKAATGPGCMATTTTGSAWR
jgi:hypothetical protein